MAKSRMASVADLIPASCVRKGIWHKTAESKPMALLVVVTPCAKGVAESILKIESVCYQLTIKWGEVRNYMQSVYNTVIEL